MKNFNVLLSVLFALPLAASLTGCPEEGEGGSEGIDCGDHGSAHEGHCHCDAGYLFDGETCVAPAEITQICEEEADEEAGEEVDEDAHEEEAHEEHGACVCPAEGACPCDHGEIEEHGGVSYCVPELHTDY